MEFITPIVDGTVPEADKMTKDMLPELDRIEKFFRDVRLTDGITLDIAKVYLPGVGVVTNYSGIVVGRFTMDEEDLVVITQEGFALNMSDFARIFRAYLEGLED